MRAKRTRRRPIARRRDGHPPDATGLTIDWLGVQATGGGAASNLPAWLVGGLVALRAAPFVAWRASRQLAAMVRRRRGSRRARRQP